MFWAGGMPQRAKVRSSSAAGCSARGSRLQWPRGFAALQRAATTRHWNYADYCSCPNWHRYRRSIKGKRLIKTCFQREFMPMSQKSERLFPTICHFIVLHIYIKLTPFFHRSRQSPRNATLSYSCINSNISIQETVMKGKKQFYLF